MNTAPLGGQESVTLPGGVPIPLIGFGTAPLVLNRAYHAVRAALDAGYRHIDTATSYRNEGRVGAAVRDSGLARQDVFITTKCPPGHAGREARTLDASLKALGVDYVDLWLVHWPPGGQASPETWRAFITALEQGKARAIGVSNYSTAQVDELTAATGVAPALNQIPWSPFAFDERRAAELRDRQVVLEAYSPLRRSDLGNQALAEIAAAHGKTPAQVSLRWQVQHGNVAIPRSRHPERIAENIAIFDFGLTPDEVRRLDALGSLPSARTCARKTKTKSIIRNGPLLGLAIYAIPARRRALAHRPPSAFGRAPGSWPKGG